MRIIDYIAQDNPDAARQLAVTIRAKAEQLRIYPYSGREVLSDVRELVVHRHYLLTYRIKGSHIEIVQVWHTAQHR